MNRIAGTFCLGMIAAALLLSLPERFAGAREASSPGGGGAPVEASGLTFTIAYKGNQTFIVCLNPVMKQFYLYEIDKDKMILRTARDLDGDMRLVKDQALVASREGDFLKRFMFPDEIRALIEKGVK